MRFGRSTGDPHLLNKTFRIPHDAAAMVAVAYSVLMVLSGIATLYAGLPVGSPLGPSARTSGPSNLHVSPPGASAALDTYHGVSPGAASRVALERALMQRALASGVPGRYVYPPNLAYGAAQTGGVISPYYTYAPAPMGIGDFGLVNTTGTSVGTILNTSSIEGTMSLNNLSAFDLLDDSPQSVTFQLNTVDVNVTFQSNASGQFWTQDVPFYSARTHTLAILDNVWNFSSYRASLPATTLTGTSAADPHGSGGQFYYDYVPVGNFSLPFTLQLYTNTSVSSPAVSPYKHYSSTVTFGVDVVKGGRSVYSSTFDTVYFNSTDTAPPATPPRYQINGQRCSDYSTTGFCLLLDAELIVGGPGGGSNAVINAINATMSIFTYDTTLSRYVPAHSAFDYGADTGETAVGVTEWYAQNGTVDLGTGPSFLSPLWNASGTIPTRGSMRVAATLSPANAFLFFEPGLKNKAQFQPADAVWSPHGATPVTNYTLMPGNYTVTGLLSDHTPVLTNFTRTATSIFVNLSANPTSGIYTPIFAQGNAQVSAVSSSGSGSPSSPYILDHAPSSALVPEFNELNDYGYPVFPSILLRDITAYTLVTGEATFSMTYAAPWSNLETALGGPATNQMPVEAYNDTHISIWGGSNLTGWLSANLLTGPDGNVIFWNTTASLIGNSTFLNNGSFTASVFVYNPANRAGGDYIWGNRLSMAPNAAVVTPPPSRLVMDGSGDTIYNNQVLTNSTADTPTYDIYTGAAASYKDLWNVSNQSASNYRLVNGLNLTGNILGLAWQGGNYWDNYYCTQRVLPYNNTGAITSGGDYLPLGCATPPGLTLTSYSIVPNPAIVGKPDNVSVVASGGVPPLTDTLTGFPGSCTGVPPLSFNCTATATGFFTVNVTVRDSANQSVNGSLTLQVNPAVTLLSTAISPPSATVGVGLPTNFNATPSCSPAPCPSSGLLIVWALNNTLGGLNTSNGPSVRFTAGATPGIAQLNLSVTYNGRTVTSTASIQIVAALQISAFGAQPSTVDALRTTYLNATVAGGLPPYTYGYSGLPSGCASANTSSLACTPSTPGTYAILLTVADAQSHTQVAQTVLVVDPSLSATLTALPATVPLGGTVYLNASAAGGAPPYSYTYAPLPAGCTSLNTASLACKPSVNGTFNVNAYVKDATGATFSTSAVFTVVGPLAVSAFTAVPANVALGQTSSLVSTVQGGFAPYSYAYSGLPSGCTSADTANLSCTASVPGRFTVTLSVTDNLGEQASGVTVLTVQSPPGYPIIASFTASPSTIALGGSTTFDVSATGGSGTLSYAYANMPPGCSPGDVSVYTCSPALSGNYSLTVTVMDSAQHASEATTELIVSPSTQVFSLVSVNITPAIGTIAVNGKVQLSAQPVCSPAPCPAFGIAYTWSVSNNLAVASPNNAQTTTLTAGSTPGTVSLNLQAQTRTGGVGTAITISILPTSSGAPRITSFSVTPNPVALGGTVQFSTVTQGGSYPLSYSYTGLAPGCASQNAAVFSCSPGIGGQFNVWVVVTDKTGKTATAQTNLSVTSPAGYPVIASFTVSPTTTSVGGSVTFSVTVHGGTGSLSYVYGGLPAGCQSTDANTLQCAPSTAGNFSVQVTVTDGAGRSVAATTHLTVLSATSSTNSGGSSLGILLVILAIVVVAVVIAIVVALWVRRRGPTTSLQPYTPTPAPTPATTPPPAPSQDLPPPSNPQ